MARFLEADGLTLGCKKHWRKNDLHNGSVCTDSVPQPIVIDEERTTFSNDRNLEIIKKNAVVPAEYGG